MIENLVVRGVQRGWVGLAMLVTTWACRQPNPEWLGPSGAPPGASDEGGTDTLGSETSPGDGATSDDGPAPTDDASDDPSAPQCAPDPVLGEGDCPGECSACEDGRCRIDCAERGCQGDTVECPEDWPCDFVCEGDSVCKKADLACARDRDCTVRCEGSDACRDTDVACGAGTCTITCDDTENACRSLDVECGPADTTITCDGPQNADAHANDHEDSCACDEFDCD